MKKKLGSIIEAQQFTKEEIETLFMITRRIKKDPPRDLLKKKTMFSVFYQPSTRTRFSMEMAMIFLGGEVIDTESAGLFSSEAKGERLEHTMRVLSGYHPDVIVIRHIQQGAAQIAAKYSLVPIINAGDGPGEHPTQGLLDLYTIDEYCGGKIKGLKIGYCGDLRSGRTIRSNVKMMGMHYPDNHLYFVSMPELCLGEDMRSFLREKNVSFEETNDMESVLPKVDIWYHTRNQMEYYKDNLKLCEAIAAASPSFRMTWERAEMMQKHAKIMHPLPIKDDVSPDMDANHRAHWFEQSDNGFLIRMGILEMMLVGC